MNTALHARRILEAWDLANFGCFEAELESALALCRTGTPASEMENEQQAVLESVVRRFREISLRRKTNFPQQFETGFFLLRHLRGRVA